MSEIIHLIPFIFACEYNPSITLRWNGVNSKNLHWLCMIRGSSQDDYLFARTLACASQDNFSVNQARCIHHKGSNIHLEEELSEYQMEMTLQDQKLAGQ